MMELKQLKMFKTVADCGSVTQAAELLFCVPSNVSARIKDLEQQLGVALFAKQGRVLKITPAGMVLRDYADQLLLLADEARRAVQSGAAPSGILRIGSIDSLAIGRLPPLISRFQSAYPAVDLQLTTATWSVLAEQLVRQQLDGALMAVRPRSAKLESVMAYNEPLVITSPRQQPVTCPQDLLGRQAYVWPTGCPYRAEFERWLDHHAVPLSTTILASYGAILGCVRTGSGVSVVPQGLLASMGPMEELHYYYPTDLKPVKSYFAWPRHSQRHAAREAFMALLSEAGTGLFQPQTLHTVAHGTKADTQ